VSISDMLATASAVIAAVAAETSRAQGGAHTKGAQAAASSAGVFNPESLLVRVEVPELLVLYGVRQALARLLDPHGHGCVPASRVWCLPIGWRKSIHSTDGRIPS